MGMMLFCRRGHFLPWTMVGHLPKRGTDSLIWWWYIRLCILNVLVGVRHVEVDEGLFMSFLDSILRYLLPASSVSDIFWKSHCHILQMYITPFIYFFFIVLMSVWSSFEDEIWFQEEPNRNFFVWHQRILWFVKEGVDLEWDY